jgi:small-conductance mechanosensitive channel/CRP-like cAMP-binding protein
MSQQSRLFQVFGPRLVTLIIFAACCAAALAFAPPWLLPFRTYGIAVVAVAAGAVVVRCTGYILFDVLFRKRKGREAPGILRFVVSAIGYSALFIIVFRFVFGRDLTGVLATSAVVSVIIGLALQDTLGNFFAGLSLHIEQPYHIGDALRMGDILGRVEAVTWRTTALRTNNGSLIIVPNSRIAREPIEIYGLDRDTRRVLKLPAPYQAAPERVISVIREAVRGVPGLAPDRAPSVRVGDFADSAVAYELMYWVKDHMTTSEVDAVVRERVWYAFQRSGLEIPFPTRQLVVHHGAPAMAGIDQKHVGAIAAVPVFSPLSADELQELAASAVRSVYAPGEEVIRQGEAGDSMFVILGGSAEVLLGAQKGPSQPVALLKAGDCFGEMALFTGESRTAEVRAAGELTLLEIRKSALEPLMRANQQLAAGFSRIIAERQAKLTEIARSAPEQQHQSASETILTRIRRFFSLH